MNVLTEFPGVVFVPRAHPDALHAVCCHDTGPDVNPRMAHCGHDCTDDDMMGDADTLEHIVCVDCATIAMSNPGICAKDGLPCPT